MALPSKGWAEMIRKVYEVDPTVCPECGGQMVVDRIIDHLKLTFVADKPPPAPLASSAQPKTHSSPMEFDLTRASLSFIIFHDGSRRFWWRDISFASVTEKRISYSK